MVSGAGVVGLHMGLHQSAFGTSKWSGMSSSFGPFMEGRTQLVPYMISHGKLMAAVPGERMILLGMEGYGRVFLCPWPHDATGLVVIKQNQDNIPREFTVHEAAILALLAGRAGAPRLIATNPEKGVIVI